ncbi:MAG: glutathione S-transferase N-terminal domain-containing protein [Deltaproteobacteria bacterium]|nr:glutathione S-transferase N-terminal domain-containing protein [Deltaproteobacteria bacterium]MBK8240353.1 glutathione S-transferase N-terminal domain-containing protein [Deltaproteobacteria bacterium]MBK8718367.1 glutathione S-transferase N-terminal domain-containing protein [Deltaproteobacteria bacterium]MBP7290384.1 glutathione S-transferase N-terminal domain-containing protein [Nannocystaceae bacterium]
MTPKLWSLPYSPWSEKAKWALEWSGVAYRRMRYQPIVDELALRWRLRRPTGVVSVPVLQHDGGVLADSFDIARWAAAQDGGDHRCIDDETLATVTAANLASERGLAAGRTLSLTRLLEHPQGLRDMTPPILARRVPGLAQRLATAGIRRTLAKYAAQVEGSPRHTLERELEQLRADLAAGHRTDGVAHLLPRFGYADIARAQVLAFVRPPTTHLRMTPATRETFVDDELSRRFDDLLQWRDALYARFRERPDRSPPR